MSGAAAPHRVSVVVIDDTPDLRLLLRVALRRYGGFEVVGEAADGRAGVDLVHSLQPDAVLLDLAMPVLDGLQALPLIRQAAPGAVVVALSGFEGAHMGAAALAAGAAAYVQKGVSPQTIVDTLVGCLGIDSPAVPPAVPALPARPHPRPAVVPAAAPSPGDEPGEAATYRLLIEQAVDKAIVAIDERGLVRTWNGFAEQLTGYRAAEMIGRRFTALYPPDEREPAARELLAQARRTRRATHHRWLVAKDGSRIWAEVVLTALGTDPGVTHGYGLVISDRTEQRRLDGAQASLFAAVAHDLRSPLAAIRAFASLFDSADDDERAVFVERIDANAEQLQRLVDGLFDYAKVRAGAVEIHPEPLHLAEVANECVQNLAAVLSDVEVVVADVDVVAQADRDAMRRVIGNLIGNSVKYSPPGTRIDIGFDRVDHRVLMWVRDQGRGIDPEDQHAVFGEFVRGRLASDDGGTGLGLASVRQLVTMQSGDVWLRSEVGEGTTVTVELPAADVAVMGPC